MVNGQGKLIKMSSRFYTARGDGQNSFSAAATADSTGESKSDLVFPGFAVKGRLVRFSNPFPAKEVVFGAKSAFFKSTVAEGAKLFLLNSRYPRRVLSPANSGYPTTAPPKSRENNRHNER